MMKKKLTERSVKQFIQLFENWASAVDIADDAIKKRRFTTAFESNLAFQWFSINNNAIKDSTMSFDRLKTSLRQNCTKDEIEKELHIYEITEYPQENGEGPQA